MAQLSASYRSGMLHQALDLLFPRRSLTGQEGEWITQEEIDALRPHPTVLTTPTLRARNMLSIDRVFSVSDVSESPLVRKALHTLKYRGLSVIAGPLGELLAHMSQLFAWESMPVVCPVPLHWSRRFSRGFNQAELLANVVAAERGWKMQSLLRRTRPTGSQVGRNRSQRLTSVANAFAATSREVPAHVLLVDDVCTTGATLDACAASLKLAGAQRVEGLVLFLG